MNPFSNIIILAVLLFTILSGAAYLNTTKTIKPVGVVCTMEAKLCPDGTYVSRTGPNCSFANCPIVVDNTIKTKSGIKGTVLLGPTCPVMKIPPDPNCADKGYQTSLVAKDLNGTQIIPQFETDAKGNFTIDIPPGEYIISTASNTKMFPRCGNSGNILVQKNIYTDVVISCDTGIR